MSKIRDWFRRWLGVEGLSYYATATDQRVDRLRQSLHQSQKDLDCNFKREVAIRDTAIASLLTRLQAVEAENVDLAREVDELKKDLIAQAIKPPPKERTEPEKRGREPWPVRRARIEAEEAKQAERN